MNKRFQRAEGYLIRPRRAADGPGLESVFAAGGESGWQRPKGSLEQQSKGESILVAERNGEILGFVSVWDPDGFIHHLYVGPGHQRQGIGRALVDAVQRRHPGPLTLKCLQANRMALDFYFATGWVEEGKGVAAEGEYLLLRRQNSAPPPAGGNWASEAAGRSHACTSPTDPPVLDALR